MPAGKIKIGEAELRPGRLGHGFPAMQPLTAPTLAEIQAARERLAGAIVRTPLVRLNAEGVEGEVWLKLETLLPCVTAVSLKA